jgi:monovalent cation/proton antiporter MnhG/PhaG subunit
MNARGVAVDGLLALGVGAEIVCALGVLTAKTVFDRLHFLSATTSVGAPAIATAVVLAHPTSSDALTALLVGLALVASGPLLTHAIARAARALLEGNASSEASEGPW